VSSSSGTYSALSGIMVTLCASFMAAWVAVIVARVLSLWRASRSSTTIGGGGRQRVWRANGLSDKRGGVSSVVRHADGAVAAINGDGASVGVATTRDCSDGASVGVTAPRAADDFVVVNPLRRPQRDVSGTAPSGDEATMVDSSAPPPLQSTSSAPSFADPVPRLQRVLTAQQPVQSSRACVL
jgi:hypothetical protein